MKILVIRYSSMGDVILITPVIRMLHMQLNASIHILTKFKFLSLLIKNPYVSKIYIHENVNKKSLKEEDYDLIVDLQKNLRSFFLIQSLRIPYITYNKLAFRNWLFLIMRVNRLKKIHVVDRYIRAIEKLGIIDDGFGLETFFKYSSKLPLHLPPQEYIVIALGGTYSTKRIPLGLVNSITNRIDQHFILIGGKDVRKDEIIERSNVANLIQNTTIASSALLIKNSLVVISGDTGMMHIAASLQKAIIVIWGSTSSDFGFYPYYGSLSNQKFVSIENDQLKCRPCSKYGRSKCPKGHMNCLNSITAQMVHHEIDLILG